MEIAIGILDLVIPMKIPTVETVAIGTLKNPLGVLEMKAKIPTGVLEIKIQIRARKAIGTLETVETRLLIQTIAIGIQALVIPIRIPTGETIVI